MRYLVSLLRGVSFSGVYKDAGTTKRYEQRMALLQQQISEIEKEMQKIIKKDDSLSTRITYMESIPGISFTSAATVVAETLGFSTIQSAKQLTSYVGYAVTFNKPLSLIF